MFGRHSPTGRRERRNSLNRPSNATVQFPRSASPDTNLESLTRCLDEIATLLVGLGQHKGGARVAVVTVEEERNVQVDDVSGEEGSAVV
jgi:hypothetical protein